MKKSNDPWVRVAQWAVRVAISGAVGLALPAVGAEPFAGNLVNAPVALWQHQGEVRAAMALSVYRYAGSPWLGTLTASQRASTNYTRSPEAALITKLNANLGTMPAGTSVGLHSRYEWGTNRIFVLRFQDEKAGRPTQVALWPFWVERQTNGNWNADAPMKVDSIFYAAVSGHPFFTNSVATNYAASATNRLTRIPLLAGTNEAPLDVWVMTENDVIHPLVDMAPQRPHLLRLVEVAQTGNLDLFAELYSEEYVQGYRSVVRSHAEAFTPVMEDFANPFHKTWIADIDLGRVILSVLADGAAWTAEDSYVLPFIRESYEASWCLTPALAPTGEISGTAVTAGRLLLSREFAEAFTRQMQLQRAPRLGYSSAEFRANRRAATEPVGVELSWPMAQALSVDWRVETTTRVQVATGRITIPAGQTTGQIDLPMAAFQHHPECFLANLALVNPSAQVQTGEYFQARVRLFSSDPVLSFESKLQTVTRTQGVARIPFQLSCKYTNVVAAVVSAHAYSTVRSNVDYAITNPIVMLAAGQQQGALEVQVLPGDHPETNAAPLALILTMESMSEDVVADPAEQFVLLYEVNSGRPRAEFASPAGINTTTNAWYDVPVAVRPAVAAEASVGYAVSPASEATAGVDYVLPPGRLTFAAGSTQQFIRVGLPLQTETNNVIKRLVLQLESPSTNLDLGGRTNFVVMIP